jgi:L-threonylcarbamoyladenylate synthase
VYGLGADACNSKAVEKIYNVKGRPVSHPLIVHISSIKNIDKWAKKIPDYALKLATVFWPGPLTLILPRSKFAQNFITGGQDFVGIRVPAHKVALSLLEEFEYQGGIGVAAPSANRFQRVSPTSASDVVTELSDYLRLDDFILDGGESFIGLESTIVDCTRKIPTIIRPGAITVLMITRVLGFKVKIVGKNKVSNIKAPGLFEKHYSPNSQVFLIGTPSEGDGFLALSGYSTPRGAIRLAAPNSNEEFANVLYKALRKADMNNLGKIYVIPPEGDGIALAIRDRLQKASSIVPYS